MASRNIFGLFLGCELLTAVLSVSRRLRLQIYELFNELTSYSGTYNKRRIKMAKMMKKPDSKLQKQQQGRLKSQTQQENTTKIYDSEVQMYARAHSGPRLAI